MFYPGILSQTNIPLLYSLCLRSSLLGQSIPVYTLPAFHSGPYAHPFLFRIHVCLILFYHRRTISAIVLSNICSIFVLPSCSSTYTFLNVGIGYPLSDMSDTFWCSYKAVPVIPSGLLQSYIMSGLLAWSFHFQCLISEICLSRISKPAV